MKNLVTVLARAFAGWVETILRSRQLLAEDGAHATKQGAAQKEPA